MIEIKKILFPTDFSETAEHAMKYAVTMAKEYDAKLIVFHAIDIEHEYFNYSATDRLETDLKHHAQKEMETVIPVECLKTICCDKIIKTGTPFVEIVRAAKEHDVDLVVIGTHGRRGLNHTLFGSTAEKVVRKAPCPVLTVKHPEHEFIHP